VNLPKVSDLEKKSIIILCYRRTTHLKQVLTALQNCTAVEDFKMVFVVQDPIAPVLQIIREFPYEKTILSIDGSAYRSAAQAINGNLFVGLDFCFSQMMSSFVIVLEDDIVLSTDALDYFDSIIQSHKNDSSFRGVNAFSEAIAEPTLGDAYVKTNFGLGWGWAMESGSYFKIRRFWRGTEDNHWDFIFEPYLRTGFVVNPIRSRMHNIGFDDSATHTSENIELGRRILDSFSSSVNEPHVQVREVDYDFFWMGEKINYSELNLRRITSNKIVHISFLLFGDSRIFHRIRRFMSEMTPKVK
jgi:hypothetical protein